MTRTDNNSRALLAAALIATAGLLVDDHARAQSDTDGTMVVLPSANAGPARVALDIPAQPLADALKTLARQSGRQVAVDAELVAGLNSPAVRGTLTLDEALQRLLAGTGLDFRFIPGGAVTLQPAPDDTGRPQWLTPIVVTPPLLGDIADTERFDRVEPTSRLTREQFEEMPNNRRLSDVMDRMPGVFFRGPVGVNRDIKLRGMDKGFTRFELDGIQLPGLGGERDFRVNRLSPLSVDVIELLRNPGASYESDGIAGRIIAQSKPIPEEFTMTGEARAGGINSLDGSYRQFRLAQGDKPSATFGYNLFIDHGRIPREKDKTKTTFDVTGDFKELEAEDERVVDDSLNLSADLGWSSGPDTLRVKPRFERQDSTKDKTKDKTKSDGGTDREREDGNGEEITGGAILEHMRRFDSGAQLKSDLSFFRTVEESFKRKRVFKGGDDGFALDKTEQETSDLDDDSWQLRSALKLPVDTWMPQELAFGIQTRWRDREQARSKIEIKPDGRFSDKTEPGDNYAVEERLLAAFVENEFFVSDRLSLKPGVRIEQVRHVARADDGTDATRTRTDVNPSLHLRYGLSEHLVFKAAASRKVNRPKFEQIVPFQKEKGDRFEEGNPNVDPAHAWTFDAGLTYNTSDALFSLLAFHKSVRNVIDVRDTGEQREGKDVFRVSNVGDGWVRGIELEQRINLRRFGDRWDGLVLWANQGFYDSELTLDETGEKQPFDEQRDYIINMGLDYRFPDGRTLLTIAGKYLGDLEKVKGPDEREVEQSRFLLDIGLRHQVSPYMTLTFDALNVLDPDQDKTLFKGSDTTFDSETPGRVFFLGVEGRF